MQGTLTIGDFARATQLSVKALRHYHRVGVLVPAEVNESSGYRRYTSDQITTAQVIRRFRELDMPLEEIAGMLGTDDLRVRNQLIAGHLDRLERTLSQTQSAVRSLRDLLGSSTPASIELRSVPPVRAAAICATVDLSDLSPWFHGAMGELDATLAARHVRAAGPAAGIYDSDLFAFERGEATVFIPVTEDLGAVGRVTTVKIPAVDLAVTIHRGSHDDVDRTYGALAAYVADHAIAIDGPIRETYLVGSRETPDTEIWSTEIGWPIFHPGPPKSLAIPTSS
jgi:DNA-binding transcriptional MerR regulator/effector-binding domain-containing protein